MKIVLRNEAGQEKVFVTSSIEDAARWAVQEGVMDDFGCTLYPDEGEGMCDDWQELLEFYA